MSAPAQSLRAPIGGKVLRFVLAFALVFVGLLGVAPAASAASAADITKALDPTQGTAAQGYLGQSDDHMQGTFQTGAVVRYRIVVSCSSLDTACVTGTVTDVLDPNLTFVEVIAPTAKNNDGQTMPINTSQSGQTVTVTVGSDAAPMQGGNTVELVLVARVKSRPASGVIPNTASVSVPSGASANSDTVKITIPSPDPNYRVTKAVASPSAAAALGEPVTYNVALEGYRYNNVQLTYPFTYVDTYPAGATVVNDGGGVVDTAAHTITWTVTGSGSAPTDPSQGTCSYTGWCTMWSKQVQISYPAPTFSGGQTVVNSVATDPTYSSGDLPELTASASKLLAGANPGMTTSKKGPAEASPGNTIKWSVSGTNSGNTTLATMTVTDTLPTGLTNLRLVRDAYYYPIDPPSAGPVTFEALVGGTWTQFATYTTTGAVTGSLTLPTGATAWRMTVAKAGAGRVLAMTMAADVPADAALGTVYTNCAQTSTTSSGVPDANKSCVDTTLVAPHAALEAFKWHVFSDTSATSVAPGESFLWGVGLKPSGTTPVTSLDFSDVLPPQFEYVTTRCIGSYGEGYGLSSSIQAVVNNTNNCNQPNVKQPDSVFVDSAGTHLAWNGVPVNPDGQATAPSAGGNFHWVIFEVRAKPGTAVANYTNQGGGGIPASAGIDTTCSLTGNYSQVTGPAPIDPDTADWDHDGNTTETICRSDDSVQVRLAAAADTTKWDKGLLPNASLKTGLPDSSCPDWGGFTRYPCTAVTEPGKDFQYKFNVQNTGNMTLTNYVGYDILPYVGDTGVSQILGGQSRATEWTPVLTGPVDILSQPDAAGTTILYNLTKNPCRPELAQGATDANWQASCDNTWYTAAQVTDWSQVKSFKILAYQATGSVWNGGEQIILQAPMKAPITAPASTSSPLDLSLAWNSVAHREFKINADGTTARLLAAEPLKVGIIVPPVSQVQIGDFVWVDTNKDGLQDTDEPGIKGVVLNVTGPDGKPVTDVFGNAVGPVTTDANGKYLFANLPVLTSGQHYTVTIDQTAASTIAALAGYSPTTAGAGSDSAKDSSTWTADSKSLTADGQKDLTLDFGFVALPQQIDLAIAKKVTSSGPYAYGSVVTYQLTPTNNGPATAKAGWSVTDLVPAGMTLVDIAGSDAHYTCVKTDPTKPVCTNDQAFPMGADLGTITVTAKITGTSTGTYHNVTYIAPAEGDLVETNPLEVPAATDDTDKSKTNNDAQADVTVKPVSEGDYVWLDNNRNGLQDGDETGVKGVVVTLTDSTGATRTATTDGSGYYSFVDLMPGADYSLTFTLPSGYNWTQQDALNANGLPSDATDSDVDPATGKTTFTAPASGSNLPDPDATDLPTVDAGVYKYNLTLDKQLVTTGIVRVGSTVEFTLTPHNEGPSAALAGWSITDVLPSGLKATDIYGSDTHYTCALAALTCTNDQLFAAGADMGTVTVKAEVQAGAVAPLTNLAYVAPKPTDGTETTPLGTPPTVPTDAKKTPTDNDGSADVPLTPYVSVGDYVWYDANRDGVQDSGEKPYANMTVNLFKGTDTSGAPLKTTTTNAAGYYSFLNLDPSTEYTIVFVKAATESFTTANAGGDTSNSATADLTDSDANVTTGAVTFTTGATGSNQPSTSAASALADNPGIDAGVIKYNLTLTKALKTGAPFTPGMLVTYTLTPHNDGPVEALAGWSVTDMLPAELTLDSMSGTGYDCTTKAGTCVADKALAAGADGSPITVVAKIGASFTGTAKNVAYVSPSSKDVPETVPLVEPSLTTDTTQPNTDNDAEASLTVTKVSIGDYFWWDTNRNGQQDADEAPVPGATVELYLNGALVKSTTTSDKGYYAFADLLPSTEYVVKFINPDPLASFTTRYEGAVETDSNANPADGTAPVVTKSSGDNLTDPDKADTPTIDAGLVKYNLLLDKSLETLGPYIPGTTQVTFVLTPHNAGPSTAEAGWSVTDILPNGLEPVAITGVGDGYTCDLAKLSCTNSLPFPAGADMGTIRVTASIKAGFLGRANNVAYVAPVKTDVVPETIPLGIPVLRDGNTDGGTDNDAQAPLTVAPVSIGDYVWLDTNRDGLQSTGEAAVAGVSVELKNNLTGAVRTTTTDGTGYYWFDNLVPGGSYTLTFTKPDGYTWTTQDAGGVTSNDKTADATDSDVDVATGAVTFLAPVEGTNATGANATDNPSLDAGLVTKINLVLAKKLASADIVKQGDVVTFTLSPSNAGPMDALAGWSVTEVLPAGLELVNMTGDGYTCDVPTATCVAAAGLPHGTFGPDITVTAKVTDKAFGSVRNVAYVSPAKGEVDETNPLSVPGPDTITGDTATDNDADAVVTLLPPAIDLVKTGVLDDKNGNGLADAGEVITYSFVVTNTGGVLLAPVTISDAMLKLTDAPCVDQLAVGETATCSTTATYKVTKRDVAKKESILNTATATGSVPGQPTKVTDTDDEETPVSPPPLPIVLPQTGSPLSVWTAAGLGVVVLSGLVLIVVSRRKRREES